MIRCSRSFNKYGSHLNGDILTRKYRSNTIDISCSGTKRLTLCILENSFGNLGRVHSIFNEEKVQKKLGGVLFQNAKKINLEVSVSPISDLWKRFYRFIGALGLYFQRGLYLLHLCLQQGCVYNLLKILKQKSRNICMGEKNHRNQAS